MNKINDQKPIANLILNGEPSDLYHTLFKSGIQGMSIKLILCFHSMSVGEILASIQMTSARTDINIRKKNAKLSLCLSDITVYVENPRKSNCSN